MRLAGFGIEAMENAAVIGDVENVVLDRDAAERAVHDFGEVNLAIAIFIDGAVMPDRRRIRIGPCEVSLFRLYRLKPLRCDWCCGVFRVERQLWAHVPALRWINAPQVACAFAVFRV